MKREQAERQDDVLTSTPQEGLELKGAPIGMGLGIYRINGAIVGINFVHLTPDLSDQCGGYLWTRPDFTDAPFAIECESPLTISPSLHCERCGTHGWIRDGKWIPA